MRAAKRKMLAGELYFANDPDWSGNGRRSAARRIQCDWSRRSCGTDGAIAPMFGGSATARHPARFHCDYGYTISRPQLLHQLQLRLPRLRSDRDRRRFAMAPSVQLYTAYHPLDRETRVAGLEFGQADPHRQRRVDRRRRDRIARGDDRRRLRRRRRQRRHARSAGRHAVGNPARIIRNPGRGGDDALRDDHGQKADAAYRRRDRGSTCRARSATSNSRRCTTR